MGGCVGIYACKPLELKGTAIYVGLSALGLGILTQVLSTPDVHEHVVFPDLLEVGLVYHEKSPRDHGSPDGLGGIELALLTLQGGEVLPLEHLKEKPGYQALTFRRIARLNLD